MTRDSGSTPDRAATVQQGAVHESPGAACGNRPNAGLSTEPVKCADWQRARLAADAIPIETQIPPNHADVIGWVSDASVSIHFYPTIMRRDGGVYWAGLPGNWLNLADKGWTVTHWRPLSTEREVERLIHKACGEKGLLWLVEQLGSIAGKQDVLAREVIMDCVVRDVRELIAALSRPIDQENEGDGRPFGQPAGQASPGAVASPSPPSGDHQAQGRGR